MARLIAATVAVALALGVGVLSPGSGAVASRCAREPLRAPAAGRPSYVLKIRLTPGLRSASGTLRLTFRPEVATSRLVLRLWPNGPAYAQSGARLSVGKIVSGGRALPTSRPDPTTLVVRRALRAGERITLSTTWTLTLPRGRGQCLHGGRYARLGSFFPLLAWNGSGWATDPPIRGALETWTSPAADFDVHVSAPARLKVLATGQEVGRGHWRARAVRDFALAVGAFSVERRVVRVPNPVQVTVGVAPGISLPPSVFLDQVAPVLREHSRRYGAYPWTTFTLAAMSDVVGRFSGIEYPNLVFLLGKDSRVVISHETAHQWFYSLVGNDQARDPWLDESLATWAQARYDGTLEGIVRLPVPAGVRNRIGEPTSFWDAFDFPTTLAGLYFQGVQALSSLGDPRRLDCALRHYVAANAYGTAVPRDLLAALEPFFPDARKKLERRGAHF